MRRICILNGSIERIEKAFGRYLKMYRMFADCLYNASGSCYYVSNMILRCSRMFLDMLWNVYGRLLCGLAVVMGCVYSVSRMCIEGLWNDQ